MIDLGVSKLALIGVVALLVIGPEKLPRVARTVGTLLGKAQRYVRDVKDEVNRSIALEELQKMRDAATSAVSSAQSHIESEAANLEKNWDAAAVEALNTPTSSTASPHRPKKNWRLKRSATPHWYKSRQKVRRNVQSGAARVARFRPR